MHNDFFKNVEDKSSLEIIRELDQLRQLETLRGKPIGYNYIVFTVLIYLLRRI